MTENLADVLGRWAASQPWWALSEQASHLNARVVVCVPKFPPALDGMTPTAIFLAHRAGARVLVEEDPLATSWYMTIAAADCAPVQDALPAVGEA